MVFQGVVSSGACALDVLLSLSVFLDFKPCPQATGFFESGKLPPTAAIRFSFSPFLAFFFFIIIQKSESKPLLPHFSLYIYIYIERKKLGYVCLMPIG